MECAVARVLSKILEVSHSILAALFIVVRTAAISVVGTMIISSPEVLLHSVTEALS